MSFFGSHDGIKNKELRFCRGLISWHTRVLKKTTMIHDSSFFLEEGEYHPIFGLLLLPSVRILGGDNARNGITPSVSQSDISMDLLINQ
jgi:hypothetical protein